MMSLLSKLYFVVGWLRSLAYERGLLRVVQLPGIVLSVGNIYVGGTGKTPYVIALAEYLNSKGKKVAILTRGYKSSLSRKQFIVLENGEPVLGNYFSTDLGADEAMMQSKILPGVAVVVGAKRAKAAKCYLAHITEKDRPDVFILDDGFQHRKIARDLDIVLFKKELGIGNGRLLPAGPLREPISSLRRADAIVVSRLADSEACSLGIESFWTQPLFPAPLTNSIVPMNQLAREAPISSQTAVSVACGIANPELFRRDLEMLGLVCREGYYGGDHEKIPQPELNDLASTGLPLITTEKDYFRQAQDFDGLSIPIFTLKMSLALNDEIKELVDRSLS